MRATWLDGQAYSSNGNDTARPVFALRATASVNSMYRTPSSNVASLACISDPSWVKTVAHLSRGAFVRRWRAETACCMFDPFTSNENPLWRGDLQNPSEFEKRIGEKCGLIGWMD